MTFDPTSVEVTWLYLRIIVSKSHGNTSMYADTVINFAKITTYILILHTHTTYTYYIQNQWSHSLFLNYVQARQKVCTFVVSHFDETYRIVCHLRFPKESILPKWHTWLYCTNLAKCVCVWSLTLLVHSTYSTTIISNCSTRLIILIWVFWRNPTPSQQMEAESQLTDPVLKLAVGGILVLGNSRRESYIFESSWPHPYWRVGWSLS